MDIVNTSSKAKETKQKQPTCLIILGMAGSGKTSFVNRLSIEKKPYIVNLDPACKNVPYQVKIDIRDTVNYKEVMKQYKLGPNGAIVTSLNLFSTQFNDVIKYIEKANDFDFCVFDTPGQIEVFTWSVSGTIITESLASSYPTVIVYVMDTVRSISPATFMSNMLYACSILYKTKLPFIVVMNKTDVVEHSYAVEWMNNFEAFQEALLAEENKTDAESNHGYMNKLVHSMSMALDEFYNNIKCCGVSSLTGDGFEDFFNLLKLAEEEFENDYKTEWEKMKSAKLKEEEQKKQKQLEKLADAKNFKKEDDFVSTSWSSEVYLKHSANESSDDSEGQEEIGALDQEPDDVSFAKMLSKHTSLQKSKLTDKETPSTSKN